ncbi:hypothetical protein CspHIS471_0104630 [Cutaneotrichosporon sp. HIS471]|nr:hypothetical protein CspHIS471_0104630 [Cutaneotrichosporon sp. HIS471]
MSQFPAPEMEMMNGVSAPLRTVVVLGVSYGGGHAAKLLASQLPSGWRVVAIDRNSHMNHVYVFPRVTALPKLAPKAFPPYTNLFKLPPAPEVDPEPGSPASFQITQKRGVTNGPHEFIHGEITRLTPNNVFFRRPEFASDIKDIWPNKEVTMLHSRKRVLPRYPLEMHDAAINGLEALGVRVVLGQRVVHWPASDAEGVEKVVTTDKGETFIADLVLPCTGTKPHSALMAAMDAHTVNPTNGRIAVRPTMQVRRFDVTHEMAGLSMDDKMVEKGLDADLDHMFAIGDSADTSAIQAGHVSFYQGVVAVKNIIKLIERENTALVNGTLSNGHAEALEDYIPTPPMLKLTLGLKHYATAMPDGVTTGDDGEDDLQARLMWGTYHADDLPDHA